MKLFNALKEVFISSLPLVAVVIVVCVFIAPMPAASDYVKLTIGYVSVVLGQAIFLEGLNISILPVGKLVGNSLVRLKKPTFIIFSAWCSGCSRRWRSRRSWCWRGRPT